jgi:probable phosphoglycerate mutase
MALTRICLARHGETNWNLERRVQGQLNIPLNVKGFAQAEALARELAGERFDRIYSSDLRRALQTAAPIASRLGLPVVASAALREKHDGEWQGLVADEVEQQFPRQYAMHRRRRPHFTILGGGESHVQFAARVRAELDAIAQRHPGEAVLVVAHAGVLDIAYRIATGVGLSVKREAPVLNAAPSWFTHENGVWRLTSWARESGRPSLAIPYEGRKLRRREAARVLLLNAANEALLLRYSTRLAPHLASRGHAHFWGAVGGAVEPGETFDRAARRELFEETGLTGVDLGPIVARREFPMQFGEDWLQASERFYAVRVGDFALDPRNFTDVERQEVLGWKWWSAEAIAASEELIFPEALDWLLESLRDA